MSEHEDVRCWRSECRTGCYYPNVCSERPVSRVQAIEAAEDRADQVAFDAWRERGL